MQRSFAEFAGSERFEVLARLGSGATGVVYSAHDREAGGRVALKVLKNVAPDSIADFKQEFRALADLDHPNLVRLGELIADHDRWLFTMELVEGVDFITFTRPDGVLDQERLRRALEQLVAALDALHQSGQVHRDVKPSNALVRDDGSVKLLDFGLVTQAADPELLPRAEAEAVGTTAYVAPEQAAGRAVGPAADFYAVGVMLYEALTGALPFDGPPLKILMDKQTQKPKPPRELAKGVDPELESLCLELLSSDPAQRPFAARITSKLRGRRGAGEANTHATRSHAFFGRVGEIDQIVREIGAERTRPLLQLVLGEPGVGKSTLLTRIGRRLKSNGALVLSGRCREAESVPYRALDGVLDELAQQLSRLPPGAAKGLFPSNAGLLGKTFPALARVDLIARAPLDTDLVVNPLEQRRRAFSALRTLLATLARRWPLVIAIDDIQWADPDSLALLRHVLTATDAPRLTLLATLDARPRESVAGQLSSTELRSTLPIETHELSLAGLDEQSATQLVQHLYEVDPPHDPPPAETVAREARGHPRMIEELVQHLKEHALGKERISVEDVVRVRMRRLPDAALRLMTLIACAGAPLSLEVLSQAAGAQPSELSSELTRLRLSRMIRVVGVRGRERVEPFHDRIREFVLDPLTDDERARCHRALALAHEAARSEDFEALSRHFRASGDRERSAEYAARAASDALSALAFDRAAALYQQAVELSGEHATPELHECHGDALVAAGRGPEGARAYLLAAAAKTGAESLDLKRRAAEQLMVCGYATEGLAAASEVVDALDLGLSQRASVGRFNALMRLFMLELRGLGYRERDTSEIAARDLARIDTCWSLFVGYAALAPLKAPDPLTLHIKLALNAGEPYRVGRGLSALSTMAGMLRGRSGARAQELAERAEAIAERLGEPHLIGLCQLNAGLRAYHAGDLDAARVAFEQGERTFQEGCRSATWELGTTHFFLLLCHLAAGDVATLTRLAADWYEEAKARGDRHAAANLRARVLPAVALLAGDVALARAHAEPPIGTAEGPFQMQHYWRDVSLSECDLFEGEHESARLRLDAMFPQLKRAHLLDVRTVFVEAHWLRARAALSGLARGAAIKPAEILGYAAQIERCDMAGAQGIGLAIRAGIAELSRDPTHAGPAWRGAEAQLRADGRALLAQLARLRRGLIARDDEAERARREAHTWLSGAGLPKPERLLDVFLPGSPLPPH